MAILKRFGDRVRELRSKKGLSQEALGFDSDLDRTYISGIERGRRNVSLVNLAKIARALKISLSKFLEGID